MTEWLNRCHFGDVRAVLRAMIAAGIKVQTIVTSPPYWGLRSYLPAEHPDKVHELGSEPTLAEFLAGMVEVFDLARQVLADDGTAWVNMGDNYLPTKQIAGQPWRLALALQDAGWWLRQDIIWHKPNPMPESIRDRCTKAHEYVFLLAKSERYFWDFEAMQEPVSGTANARRPKAADNARGVGWGHGTDAEERQRGRIKRTADDPQPGVGRRRVHDFTETGRRGSGDKLNESYDAAVSKGDLTTMRNRRSVWTVPSRPYSEAHFATFPPELIEPCILAGSRPGDTVLDIFMGSGTTGQVAQKLGRNYIGIELNRDNERLQADRTRQPSLLAGVA